MWTEPIETMHQDTTFYPRKEQFLNIQAIDLIKRPLPKRRRHNHSDYGYYLQQSPRYHYGNHERLDSIDDRFYQ